MTATDGRRQREQAADGHARRSATSRSTSTRCARPARASPRRTNDQGTHWVLLCRKSIGGLASNQYNDIAMIGHNPFTGKTCFFQNALYSKTDGGHVPHPGRPRRSRRICGAACTAASARGIECNRCHDADPFIHSPWIDGAKDAQGSPIVPKMGIDPDFAIGANDTPYAIVNLDGQHWTQEKQLVSAEANACLRCHRMGGGDVGRPSTSIAARGHRHVVDRDHDRRVEPAVAQVLDAARRRVRHRRGVDRVGVREGAACSSRSAAQRRPIRRASGRTFRSRSVRTPAAVASCATRSTSPTTSSRSRRPRCSA